jgi:hypothetical protein
LNDATAYSTVKGLKRDMPYLRIEVLQQPHVGVGFALDVHDALQIGREIHVENALGRDPKDGGRVATRETDAGDSRRRLLGQ